MSQVVTVNPSGLIDFLEDNQDNSVLITGKPGIGKTALVRQYAQKVGMPIHEELAHLLDPLDIRGLPWPDKDANRARWCLPDFLPPDGAPPQIFFWDEITAAERRVQVALYKLIFEGEVAGYKLPPGTRHIGAGNGLSDGAVAHSLSSALASRFVHCELVINADEWLQWALMHNVHGLILGYIKWKGDEALHNHDPKKNERAFACPRTWEMANRTMQRLVGSEHFNKDNGALADRVENAVGGAIGLTEARFFRSFCEMASELSSIDDIFEGRPVQTPRPDELNKLHALMGGITSRLVQAERQKHPDLFRFITNAVRFCKNIEAEYVAGMFTDLAPTPVSDVMIENDDYKQWARANAELFKRSAA